MHWQVMSCKYPRKATRSLTNTINMEEIMNSEFDIFGIPASQLALAGPMSALATNALYAANVIAAHTDGLFGIGRKEILIFSVKNDDGYEGHAYVDIAPTFRYVDNQDGGREYQFTCDHEGIYRMMRSCYLRANGMQQLDPAPFDCPIEDIDERFWQVIEALTESGNKIECTVCECGAKCEG